MEHKPGNTVGRASLLALAGLLALALVACPKQDEVAGGEPPRAVAGPVQVPAAGELPDTVLGWAAVGDLRGLLQRAEALAGQAGPVPPGSLTDQVAQGLQQAGLKDLGAVDLGAPLALVFLDPRRFTQGPLAGALVTKGQPAALAALTPFWKKVGEADGVLELSHEEPNPYGVFEGGRDKAPPIKMSMFLRFQGPVALVATSREALQAAQPILLERISKSAPAEGLVMSFRLDHVRKAFQAELAMAPEMIKQQAMAGMSGQDMGGVSPEQMQFMLSWFVDKGFSTLNQIREVGFAAGLGPEAAHLTLGLQPEQGSFFQTLLAAQKPSPASLTLADWLPAESFLAAAIDVQWKPFQADLLAFSEEMLKVFYGPEMPAGIGPLMRDLVDLLGEQVVMSEDFGARGLLVAEVFTVRDAARFREVMTGMFTLLGEHLSKVGLPQMGIRMSIEGPKDLGKHGEIPLTGYDFVFDLASLPPPQAEAMKRVYGGDRMRLGMAAWDGKVAVVVDAQPEAELAALLKRAEAKAPGAGLASTPAFRSAAGGLEQGAGGWFFLSVTRMLAWTMESTRAAMGAPPMELPKLPPARSGMFFRVGQTAGRLEITTRFPSEHVKELGEAFRSLAQASAPAPSPPAPAEKAR